MLKGTSDDERVRPSSPVLSLLLLGFPPNSFPRICSARDMIDVVDVQRQKETRLLHRVEQRRLIEQKKEKLKPKG